jgi:hypothetical protein
MNTVLKANGLKEKSSRNNVLGITETNTVMLDFDDTPFKTVKYWASRTCKWFRLKGFIIEKSSENCYHVVFDRKVSWSKNVAVTAWVSLYAHHPALTKWFHMQCMKQESTLRVSPKGEKSSPRIVYRFGKQDSQIQEFLQYRGMIKSFIKKLVLSQNQLG